MNIFKFSNSDIDLVRDAFEYAKQKISNENDEYLKEKGPSYFHEYRLHNMKSADYRMKSNGFFFGMERLRRQWGCHFVLTITGKGNNRKIVVQDNIGTEKLIAKFPNYKEVIDEFLILQK